MNSPHYILEDFNFNFWFVRLCDLDILREQWLTYLQTVEPLIKLRIPQFASNPFKGLQTTMG